MNRGFLGQYGPLLLALTLLLSGLVFVHSPPGEGGEERRAQDQLPPQVHDLVDQVAAGRVGEPYALTLSDEELTSVARYFLTVPDGPFTSVRVDVTGKHVVIDGVARKLGITTSLRLLVVVSARDGRPVASVERVETRLPGFIRARIEEEVNAALDLSRHRLPIAVDAVELRPSGLTIRGTVRARGASDASPPAAHGGPP